MPRIRPAKREDLEAIRVCAVAAYSQYVERIGKKPAPMVADFAAAIENGNIFLIANAGKVQGFVVFYPREDHIHLENVAVDPAHQGLGLGFKLIEFAEQQARNTGFDRIELYTNAKMTENLKYYPGLGYREFDRRFEDGFDRVYFEKIL